MGNLIDAIKNLFADFGTTEKRIRLLGLDAAGKSTILYRLKLGEVVTTIPTIGFNVETVTYKNVSFNMWDVGGQDRIRALWRHYLENTDALIWVVDSNDPSRFDECALELDKLLRDDHLRDCPLLVLANKQDLPGARSIAELADALKLHSQRGRQWFVQGTAATSGEGIYEGLDWLATILKKKG